MSGAGSPSGRPARKPTGARLRGGDDLDNVYVTDASFFPTSLLVNPQMTVYALSNYLADGMIARG